MQSLDNALFGSHANAMRVFSQRSKTLATNIVNADTPNFKARDVDFERVLGAAGGGHTAVRQTDPRHLSSIDAGPGAVLKYRLPMQPSQDGNTVEAEVEQAAFAENALRYQSTLMFLSGRIRTLKNAISGGTQ